MKTTSLAGIFGAFLLTTVSAFGIGPGDNARPFMACCSNLAIQFYGSTNAATTAEALVSAGTENSEGNIIQERLPSVSGQ